jgi:hypothetical protein
MSLMPSTRIVTLFRGEKGASLQGLMQLDPVIHRTGFDTQIFGGSFSSSEYAHRLGMQHNFAASGIVGRSHSSSLRFPFLIFGTCRFLPDAKATRQSPERVGMFAYHVNPAKLFIGKYRDLKESGRISEQVKRVNLNLV